MTYKSEAIEYTARESQYIQILPQIESLLRSESDFIANLSNLSAILKTSFNFLWVGFYIVKANSLVLGPFQGPVACTRIQYGRGVCGAAWKQKREIIVGDVDSFPDHIACNSLSRSEIVVPLLKGDEVVAVLDVDSEHYDYFSDVDARYLKTIIGYITL